MVLGKLPYHEAMVSVSCTASWVLQACWYCRSTLALEQKNGIRGDIAALCFRRGEDRYEVLGFDVHVKRGSNGSCVCSNKDRARDQWQPLSSAGALADAAA